MATRIGAVAALALMAALPAQAQGTVAPVAKQTFLDTNGNPLALGRLYVYQGGTTTPATIYTDQTLTVAALNAAVCACSNLDVSGRFTYFLAPATYRFALKTSSDVLVWDVDGVPSVPTYASNLDITGTAGEALTAGQIVYLSDGSGSKQQGRWYKADGALTYSSSLPVIGLVPSDIASGGTGTIRRDGLSTGLSGLSVGATYYIGSAGALTATAPPNGRAVGVADSASSLVLSVTSNADNGIDDFRLTLESGVPVSRTDQTAKTTIYATPAGRGNRIALYDSAGTATIYTSAQFSIAVPATTNTLYDVFAYTTSGTPALELTAWRNSGQAITGATNATPIVITANAHGLSNGDEVYIAGVVGNTAANGTWTVANVAANTFELATSIGNGAYTAATGFLSARTSAGKLVLTTTGTYTKTADLTRRYLGSCSTTGVSGQTEDSATKRYLWNYYNRARRTLLRRESTATYTYTTATWRQTHADTANQVEAVIGVADAPVALTSMSLFTTATASLAVAIGIGVDTTTIPNTSLIGGSGDSGTGNVFTPLIIRGDLLTSAGRHYFAMLEFSTASGTTTWYGGGSLVTAIVETGITGFIEG